MADFLADAATVLATQPPPSSDPIEAWGHFANVIVDGVACIFLLFFGFRSLGRKPIPGWFGCVSLAALAIIIVTYIIAGRMPFRPSNPATSSQARASQSDANMASIQNIVRTYMFSRTGSLSTVQYLSWSDLQNSGTDWFVTVRYSVSAPGGGRTTATVRFTVRSGTVIGAQVLSNW